ncbi:hypothetical protein Csa_018493 [Cucumis sativus]|nr:hypothetical protein Csa_018493 [Cucumis sativus]
MYWIFDGSNGPLILSMNLMIALSGRTLLDGSEKRKNLEDKNFNMVTVNHGMNDECFSCGGLSNKKQFMPSNFELMESWAFENIKDENRITIVMIGLKRTQKSKYDKGNKDADTTFGDGRQHLARLRVDVRSSNGQRHSTFGDVARGIAILRYTTEHMEKKYDLVQAKILMSWIPEHAFNSFRCKSPTPDEKTEEKERILVPKNESMNRSKVLKSHAKLPKNDTPNRLKLPIAFKYPEKYKSLTDLMISPINTGLLARTRK